MEIIVFLAVFLFVAAYVLVVLEHKLQTHKSAVFLSTAGLMWILVSASGIEREVLQEKLFHIGNDIFGIVAFLLAAMTLVEILIHYRFFDIIRMKLAALNLNDRAQFLLISLLTFFLSAVLDNLTVTIVMVQIARRFFNKANLPAVVAGIVILANAGGAWSPIGDVTTIMLWLADKFTAMEIIRDTFLPAFVLGSVAALIIARGIKGDTTGIKENEVITLTRGEKGVISLSLFSFSLPLIMNLFGLPPYMGLLVGLGFVWMFIEFVQTRSKKESHLEANIEHMLQKADISSLNFFIGILLAVGALETLGILDTISHFMFGATPAFERIAAGNILLGVISSVLDNVPLTALAIDLIKSTDPRLWTLLALTVGTGGSFLVIGSVSGVVAMGMVKELTFGKYLKVATIPAVVGYIAGVLVWWVVNVGF